MTNLPSTNFATHSTQPQLRRAPGVRLNKSEIALLKQAFVGQPTLFVEREFRSGYSGALVLLISTTADQAPIVVKLAHPHDLAREYSAYQTYVVTSAPQNTARLHDEPLVAEDGQLGLLQYTFAGGDSHLPSSSLDRYYYAQGAGATVEVLNRIFRVYGRHWWAINQPHKFVLGEEYDSLLPVHLQLSQIEEDPFQTEFILEAGESSVIDLRGIRVGDCVALCNFHIAKSNPSKKTMTLTTDPPEGEATAPSRIRIVWDKSFTHRPGDQLENIVGRVTATRKTLLAEAAHTAVDEFEVNKRLFMPPGFDKNKHALQPLNPLYTLDSLLDRVVEMRLSTIHGDLNMQNVLVDTPTGFAWLIDFADTRHGPTLFDLQRLEVQIITKLLPAVVADYDLESAVMVEIMKSLHADPPMPTAPHTTLQEPYRVLAGLRRIARQYLMDDLDWDEYYLGLTVAAVGALKFAELDDVALGLVLTAASTAQALLGTPLYDNLPVPVEASSNTSTTATIIATAEMPPMEIARPPEPTRPPIMADFVGRDAELTAYAEQINHDHLVILSGMAGVGKTALATTLTQWVARSEQVFWHSFHEGDGVDVMIWKLAAFLAWHGRDDLWELLERARQTGGQPPPVETLIDYLLQLLRGQPYLLCFDDFHFVEEDPALEQLMKRLLELLEKGGPSIVITTRRMPEFAQRYGFEPVIGLNVADTRRLLAVHSLTFEDEVVNELHQRTAGNAQFLTLAINILQQATDPLLLLERLSEADDMERYLLTRVDEGLSGAERSVMNSVAVLLGYPGTRDAIETILNSGNVWRTLHSLHERHLLTVTEGEAGKEYNQHAIVQGFYYQELSRRQCRQMHYRAGEFYEREEPDLLRSGIHYERAAAYALAVKQATADVWAIINLGQARVLRRLLEQFRTEQVEQGHLNFEQWSEVNLARGVNYTFLGEREKARESYQAALSTLEALDPKERVRTLKAHVYRGMGELLELENPEEALAWLMHGLEEADEGSEESAALLIKAGTANLYLGKYAEAIRHLEEGLALLPAGPSQLRCIALTNLGGVYFYKGDLEQALQVHQNALTISQQLHDHFQTVNILIGQGIEKYCQGSWQEAINDFKQALSLAKSLGSERLQTEVEINLGAAYINTGDDKPAYHHLMHSLKLAEANHLQVVEIFAQFRLADLKIRLGEWSAAAIHLSKADQLAQEIRHQSSLIAIYRGWAELKLASGESDIALAYAEKSVKLAEELSETLDKGGSLRILGKVLLIIGNGRQALQALEESLSLLIEEDPYEAARTMIPLGLYLLDELEPTRGEQLIQNAKTTFLKLGAKRDLDMLDLQISQKSNLS